MRILRPPPFLRGEGHEEEPEGQEGETNPMITEEEAAKRHCCGPIGTGNVVCMEATWSAQGELLAANSGTLAAIGLVPRACIGSRCMAWRWSGHEGRAGGAVDLDRARGYCGLAGSPVSP